MKIVDRSHEGISHVNGRYRECVQWDGTDDMLSWIVGWIDGRINIMCLNKGDFVLKSGNRFSVHYEVEIIPAMTFVDREPDLFEVFDEDDRRRRVARAS